MISCWSIKYQKTVKNVNQTKAKIQPQMSFFFFFVPTNSPQPRDQQFTLIEDKIFTFKKLEPENFSIFFLKKKKKKKTQND